MIKNILGTTGTRILNAIIVLIILVILTQEIGSEGYGVITLILIAITIIQLFIDLIAGSALVYFSSRTDTVKLLLPSYLWIIVVLGIAWAVFLLIHSFFPGLYSLIIPGEYESDILILAFFNAAMLTNYNLLLGQKRIGTYNIIFTIQVLTLLITLIYRFYVYGDPSVYSWIISLLISYGIGFILSFIAVISTIGTYNISGLSVIVKKVFRYGMITQLANILHIGNKRLSFYFVKSFTGISAVGVYGAGTQLTEGLRLIGQSISLVQFSEISNSNDKGFAVRITIKLMKFSVLLTTCAILVLVVLPTNIYSLIFGTEFTELKLVIIALSPGVVALSANTIFSHYFSGLGKPQISLWANGIGFIITVTLAILLIPIFGFVGAACTVSASYISSVIYQYIVFTRETGTKAREWLPQRNDIRDLVVILKNLKTGR